MIDTRRTFLDKCIKGPDGKLVLSQRPNLPIIVWAAAWLLARILHGSAQHLAMLAGTAALLLWALLELFQGINYARRTLGFVVLAMIVIGVIAGW